MIVEIGHFALIARAGRRRCSVAWCRSGAWRGTTVRWRASAQAAMPIARFLLVALAFAALTILCALRFLGRERRRQFPLDCSR